jgi:GTP-binding protein
VKIVNVELVTSAAADGPRRGLVRDDVPQFAFVGRSNVGKSSLLNALVRRRIARTSATPGKTRQANIYLVTIDGGAGGPGTWRTYLVDLPGYGYARGSREAARELADVVEAYFATGLRGRRDDEQDPVEGPRRRGVFLLVDARHPGLPLDRQAFDWITQTVERPRIVATKIDKLSRSARAKNLREIARHFDAEPIGVSSETGEGIDELWRVVATLARS